MRSRSSYTFFSPIRTVIDESMTFDEKLIAAWEGGTSTEEIKKLLISRRAKSQKDVKRDMQAHQKRLKTDSPDVLVALERIYQIRTETESTKKEIENVAG